MRPTGGAGCAQKRHDAHAQLFGGSFGTNYGDAGPRTGLTRERALRRHGVCRGDLGLRVSGTGGFWDWTGPTRRSQLQGPLSRGRATPLPGAQLAALTRY